MMARWYLIFYERTSLPNLVLLEPSSVMKELIFATSSLKHCYLIIESNTTLACHPQTNGQTEEANREVKQISSTEFI